MNKILLVYEKNTGKIKQVHSATSPDIIETAKTLISEDMDYIDVEFFNFTPDTHYVDPETKIVKEKGDNPTPFHTWDYSQKQWIFDPENGAQLIREKRDELLKQSDWSQGLDVPENLRTVWAVYRNDLRNIPQQEGFPEQVTWPTPPEGT